VRVILELLGVGLVFYVGVRLGVRSALRARKPELLPQPQGCPVCGSGARWEGKIVHYTDCKTGLG
jgi:hypothetical protein